MAKKAVKTSAKKVTSKKPRAAKTQARTVRKIALPEIKTGDESQKILLENFVGLQSVMTNLSSRLNDLTEKISKLLDLFETSAKAITEKGGLISELGQNKEVSEKLNKLLDQNKVLAQGIALLHESNAGQNQYENPEEFPGPQNQGPPPGQPPQQQGIRPPSAPQEQAGQMQRNQDPARYQKSISSKY